MATHLLPGETAPLFSGLDQDDRQFSLANLKGKKIVLFFYPEDDTPTCTVQACNLRDHHSELVQQGFTVIGISPNDSESHKSFITKFGLPFTLIADPEKKIINLYGVWGEKNLYGRKYQGLHRTTFLINEAGIIEKIFRKPRNKAHAAEILK
ncbi:MAG TPA: thioredoxin-dependent thiol peroxidase [Flavisolibacter sp.]|jgi:peroxiredoxin Q/BCP